MQTSGIASEDNVRIIGVETIRIAEYGNLVWLRLHTAEGLIGLGETFRNPDATVAYLHETLAPNLIGQNPLRRDALMQDLTRRIGNHFNGFPTRSVEMSGNSAIDIALWDIGAQAANVPIYQLLGGLSRDRVPIYNTCAGAQYNNRLRSGYNTDLISRDDGAPDRIGRHEDLLRQVHEPADLAEELLEEGITAMKIWPFDVFALRNSGECIGPHELKQALWPVEEIRKAVGDRMDIMIEYHGLWRLPAALQIAEALEDHAIYWHEEPIWMQNFDDLARYRSKVKGRVCGSENLGTVPWYREVFTRGALDVANFDMGWIGGLSAGQKIMHLADAFDRPVAPHDCTGPVTLIANLHLLLSAPNALLAETVRAHVQGFYRDIVTEMPRVENGYIYPLAGPGLSTSLNPEIFHRKDTVVRLTGTACDQPGKPVKQPDASSRHRD